MANMHIIKDLCNQKNITLKELAAEVGITEVGLQRIMKTNSTKVDTIEKIAKVLKVSVGVFFVDKKLNPDVICDFYTSTLSKMLTNRYDKISDKLSILKDYYIWEFVNMLLKREIPMYPISYPNSPEYLISLDNEADRWLVKNTSLLKLYIKTPYNKMDKLSKETFSKHEYIFDGFYFQLFEYNTLNIFDYLNEGLIIDKEVETYWQKYNHILKIQPNSRT